MVSHNLADIRPSRGLAFAVLAAVLLLLFSMAAPVCAHASGRTYGKLCCKYESGGDPGAYDSGEAYGAYQMGTYSAHHFALWMMESDDELTAHYGRKLNKGYIADGNCCGKNFDKAWDSMATYARTAFYNLQYKYCLIAYYDEAVSMWKKVAPSFDPNDYSIAIRNAIFSASLQHGPYGSAYYVFKNAMDSIGGFQKGMAEDVLLNAIYYERGRVVKKAPKPGAHRISKTDSTAKKYGIAGMYMVHFYSCPSSWQVAIYHRLHSAERKDALKLWRNYGEQCKHKKTKGGVKSIQSITDLNHVEKTTAVVCKTCKSVVKAATKKTVKNTYSMSGLEWKAACGRSMVIHTTDRYYKAKAKVKLHAKANTKAKVVALLKKGAVARPIKAFMGKDGYWWGKFSVSKKVKVKVKVKGKTKIKTKKRVKVKKVLGFCRMYVFNPLGTASGHAFNSHGRCKYCGGTAQQLANTEAGSYTLAEDTKVYVAAYYASGVKKTVKAGTSIQITQVGKNRFNDLWGQLSGGAWVKMSKLTKVADAVEDEAPSASE